MKDYAVVALSGKQYRISQGDKITIDRQSGKVGDVVNLAPVLLQRKGGQIEIGQPHLDTLITAKIIEEKLGDKIRVFKYKAKSRYRKTRGFRAQQTVLEISTLGEVQATREKASPAKPRKTSITAK